MSDRDFPKYISEKQFRDIVDALSQKTKALFVSNAVYKNKIKELEATIEADNLKITYLENKIATLEATLNEIKAMTLAVDRMANAETLEEILQYDWEFHTLIAKVARS